MCPQEKFYPFGIRKDLTETDLNTHLTKLRQLINKCNELKFKIQKNDRQFTSYEDALYTWKLMNETSKYSGNKEPLDIIKKLYKMECDLPTSEGSSTLERARYFLSRKFCTDTQQFVINMNYDCDKQDIIDMIDTLNKINERSLVVFAQGSTIIDDQQFNETNPNKIQIMYNLLHSEHMSDELKNEYYALNDYHKNEHEIINRIEFASFDLEFEDIVSNLHDKMDNIGLRFHFTNL